MDTRSKDQKLKLVKTDIELKIIAGEYMVGERVPSVRSMKDTYPIGDAWARIVLKELCDEKTLTLEQGIGYKVSSQAPKRLRKKYQEALYDIFSRACEDAVKVGINPIEMVQDIMNNREKSSSTHQPESGQND